jgi:photosystem II stability/assembly factor-like uncharacterized protein
MKKSWLAVAVAVCAVALSGTSWQGPDGLGGESPYSGAGAWTELGPLGGNVRAIVRNPKAPAELYAVTYSGLVYRSGNNGASWARKASLGDGIYDLAIDPKTPSTLYALGGGIIFKSVNKGVTFTQIQFGDNIISYNGRIAVHPSNPQVLFVGGTFTYDTTNWKSCMAVLKSVNGGQTWTVQKLEPTSKWAATYDVAVSPKNPSLVFACGYYSTATGTITPAIFRSTNGGTTWKKVTPSLLSQVPYYYPYAIAADPANAQKAYIGYNGGVVRTADGGTTWTKQASPSYLAGYALAIDKSAPNTVYAGSYKAAYKSTDGGANWTEYSKGLFGGASKLLVQGQIVHFASHAGIFRSVNGGGLFAPGHKGMLAADITGFVRVPAGTGAADGGAATFYAAAGGYGIFKSTDGTAWSKLADFQGSDSVAHIVAPRSDARRIYVSTYG